MMPATKLRLLGWLHVLLGGAGIAFGLVLLLSVAMSTHKGIGAGIVVVPLVLFFGTVFFIPAFVGGVGLLHRRPWARVLLIVLAVIELLAVPIGTVIGAFALWVLFDRGTKALLDAARTGAGSPPLAVSVPRFIAERAGVLLALVGVGAGFIVVIGAGFKLSGQQAPAEIALLFYPATAVFVLVLVVAAPLIARHRARVRQGGTGALHVRKDERSGARRRVPFDADRR